jgi:hypothetical protein
MNKLRLVELGTAAAGTAAIAVAAALADSSPQFTVIAVFIVLIVAAENTTVNLPSSAGVSPSFMVVMASIAFLADGEAALFSVTLIGFFGGLNLRFLRSRRFRTVAFNCGQFALAAAAAAAAFTLIPSDSGAWNLLAVVAATLAYGVVNIALVLPELSLSLDERPAVVWAGMRPAVPNYLAFGLLGLLMGQLSHALGPAGIVLLAAPLIIGRSTFASFLRLRESHEAAIGIFIRLIEAKDPYTAGHTERVAKYAQYMAEELDLPASRYDHLRHAALMHDVGKLAVPNRLLNKPGRLTEEEYAVVRRHNDVCIDILARVDFMREMTVIASDRHGRFEHSAGDTHELVLEAHVVAVADAFDAMTSTRSYRQALDQDVAFSELRKNAGTQFNPQCVEALVRAVEGRGERYGLGHEDGAHQFSVAPPVAGVGSAGLGDLSPTGSP